MIRGATRDDEYLPDIADGLWGEAQPIEHHPTVRAHPLGERVGQRRGLLVDLFKHEGFVSRFLSGFLVPIDGLDLPLDPGALHVEDQSAAPRDHHHIPVFGKDHGTGLCEEGGNGRGQVVLALAQTHNERRLLAHPHDHIGFIDCYGTVGEVPLHLPVGFYHGMAKGSSIGALDEMRHHLGIGLRRERVPLRLKLGPQAEVVFHDAVEDDGEASAAVGVGMSILVGGSPVCRPSGVSDTYRPAVAEFMKHRFEIVEVAHRVKELEAALGDYEIPASPYPDTRACADPEGCPGTACHRRNR
jgi:hypothetical protein